MASSHDYRDDATMNNLPKIASDSSPLISRSVKSPDNETVVKTPVGSRLDEHGSSETAAKTPIASVFEQCPDETRQFTHVVNTEDYTEPKLPYSQMEHAPPSDITEPKLPYSMNNENSNQRHSIGSSGCMAQDVTQPKGFYGNNSSGATDDVAFNSQPAAQGNNFHDVPVNGNECSESTHEPKISRQITINTSGDTHIYTLTNDGKPEKQRITTDLQRRLREHAQVFAGHFKSPVELQKALKYVSLEVSTTFQRASLDLKDAAHPSRKALEKMFERPHGDVVIDDLFKKAEESAMRDAQRVGAAAHNYIKKHGHTLGVVGHPGIGKTTLSQILTQKVLQGTMCPEVEYLVVIKVNSLDLKRKYNNALEFLLTSCLPDFQHSQEVDRLLLEELQNNPKVMIIIDGIDEANVSLSSEVGNCNLYGRHTGEVILKNILQGNFFPFAYKVVVGRVRQFFQLSPNYRPKFVLEVNGFTLDSQKDICHQICGLQAAAVIQYLHEHPNIASYCYVPVNCIITMETLRRSLLSTEQLHIQSTTHVFTISFKTYLDSDHIQPSGDVRQSSYIAHLAWNGFIERKYIFSCEDYGRVDLSEESANAFLSIHVDNKQIRSRHQLDSPSCFSHLTLQEYHAARFGILYMPVDEFKKHEETFCSAHGIVVTQFMFGMCNRTVFDEVSQIPSYHQVTDYEAKKKILIEMAMSNFQQVFVNDSVETPKLLQVCGWLYEANNPEITSAVCSTTIPDSLNISGLLLPSDAASLAFFLQNLYGTHKLNLGTEFSNIRFGDNALSTLLNGIKECRNIKVSQFHASKSPVTDAVVKDLNECIAGGLDALTLELWDLSDNHLQSLTEAITKSQNKIPAVNFSHTKISETGAKHFAKCISNIEGAKLIGCDINGVGAGYLAEGLRCPISSLNLQDNPIGDLGASKLAPHLDHFKELLLERCGIGPKGAETFGDYAANLQTPMEHFNISCNKIQDEGLSKTS
nr:uncharacterized protein LOC100180322 isoform X1 [Ciona intestinalis]XP_026691827.1 uncharacterized protein LOC100180322 isoform X2 [Ciona intestinalis]|eukprot:XP_018669056.1 uncharacterized protein LOC100180322 isoform X1 [Ciona intestinalis]